MSLSIQYESVEEATMRLSDTVVLYDGDPVYISRVAEAEGVDDVFRVYAHPLPYRGDRAGDEFRRYISSKKFDLATIKMGFVNHKEGGITYCSRLPKKQFKQGLSAATMSTQPVPGIPGAMFRGAKGGFRQLIETQEFVDCIKGKYPTMAEALDKVSKDGGAVAFSREFAFVADTDIDGLVYLYNKTNKIGFMKNVGEVRIGKAYKCLREVLAENKLRIALA